MECPVCKTIASQPDQLKCTVCATDLEIFLLLDNLERKSGNRNRIIVILAMLLVLVTSAALFFYFYFLEHDQNRVQQNSETISQQQIEIQTLTNEKQMLMTANIALRRELEALTNQLEDLAQDQQAPEVRSAPAFREITHVVRRGDNLKKLAYQYYGNTDEYVRIMRDNNISNPNHIRINQRLRIIVPVTD